MRAADVLGAVRRSVGPHVEAGCRAVAVSLAPSDRTLAQLVARWESPPRISVIIPVYSPPEAWLRAAVESVRDQIYPHWQLCLSDDASPDAWLPDYLAELATDARISVVRRQINGHISAASNSALSLANGDLIALMDNDDTLAPTALLHLALAATSCPAAVAFYSDEDVVDQRGSPLWSYRKPAWDPDLLLASNYLNHLTCLRREAMTAVGGFRVGMEGSQDHDLLLRVTAGRRARVAHIPHVLYHWRAHEASTAAGIGVKSYALDAAERSIIAALDLQGVSARWEFVPERGYRIAPPPAAAPASMAVVRVQRPTDGRALAKAIAGSPEATITVLLAAGAQEPDLPCWKELVALHLDRPGVGAVGGKVLGPEEVVIDGALWCGLGSIFGSPVHTAYHSLGPEEPGPNARAALLQSVTALSGSFLAVRSSTLREVGGVDERLHSYADVDLCQRIRAHGLRCVWVPELVVRAGWAPERPKGLEAMRLRWRWPDLRRRDPAYPTAFRRRGHNSVERYFHDPGGRRDARRLLTRILSKQADLAREQARATS